MTDEAYERLKEICRRRRAREHAAARYRPTPPALYDAADVVDPDRVYEMLAARGPRGPADRPNAQRPSRELAFDRQDWSQPGWWHGP